MPDKVSDVDEYIAQASDITRPILVAMRRIFQQASPKLEESIKWNVPFYGYEGPVGGFSAMKKHVSWGLTKADLLDDPDGLIGQGIRAGGKIESLDQVPPAAAFIKLIKQAMALNAAGVKPVTPDPDLPADFAVAIHANRQAARQYADFTAARKWQYVNWITNAKRAETRSKRIATAVEWIREGKTLK